MEGITSSINFATVPLGDQLEAFREKDLYDPTLPQPERISNVVVPLLMTRSKDPVGREEQRFDRLTNSFVDNVVVHTVFQRVKTVADQTLGKQLSEAMNNPEMLHRLLPSNHEIVENAKKQVESYLDSLPIAQKASTLSFLKYFSVRLEEKLSLFIPLLRAVQPVIYQELIDKISAHESLDALRNSCPNMFHNMMWFSLIPYSPHMEEFRQLLIEVDQCSESQQQTIALILKDPSIETTDKTVLNLIKRWEELQKNVSKKGELPFPVQTIHGLLRNYGKEKTCALIDTSINAQELTYQGFFEDVFRAFTL